MLGTSVWGGLRACQVTIGWLATGQRTPHRDPTANTGGRVHGQPWVVSCRSSVQRGAMRAGPCGSKQGAFGARRPARCRPAFLGASKGGTQLLTATRPTSPAVVPIPASLANKPRLSYVGVEAVASGTPTTLSYPAACYAAEGVGWLTLSANGSLAAPTQPVLNVVALKVLNALTACAPSWLLYATGGDGMSPDKASYGPRLEVRRCTARPGPCASATRHT